MTVSDVKGGHVVKTANVYLLVHACLGCFWAVGCEGSRFGVLKSQRSALCKLVA